jgi:hypothetical protein
MSTHGYMSTHGEHVWITGSLLWARLWVLSSHFLIGRCLTRRLGVFILFNTVTVTMNGLYKM